MIIGLTGYAGCGKTTCASYLVNTYGFTEISFADPIKEAVCAMLKITRKELDDYKISKEPIPLINQPMRYLLQTLGTDWGRNMINSDIWLILAKNRILELLDDTNCNIVIADIRFINEVNLIKELGGHIIFIDGNPTRIRNRLNLTEQSHESESYLKDTYKLADVIIKNNKSKANLFIHLDTLLLRLAKARTKSLKFQLCVQAVRKLILSIKHSFVCNVCTRIRDKVCSFLRKS
jgi:dephospho-CoA kinase